MARQVLDALAEHGISGESVRVVDHDVKPGVQTDMGDGDVATDPTEAAGRRRARPRDPDLGRTPGQPRSARP